MIKKLILLCTLLSVNAVCVAGDWYTTLNLWITNNLEEDIEIATARGWEILKSREEKNLSYRDLTWVNEGYFKWGFRNITKPASEFKLYIVEGLVPDTVFITQTAEYVDTQQNTYDVTKPIVITIKSLDQVYISQY